MTEINRVVQFSLRFDTSFTFKEMYCSWLFHGLIGGVNESKASGNEESGAIWSKSEHLKQDEPKAFIGIKRKHSDRHTQIQADWLPGCLTLLSDLLSWLTEWKSDCFLPWSLYALSSIVNEDNTRSIIAFSSIFPWLLISLIILLRVISLLANSNRVHISTSMAFPFVNNSGVSVPQGTLWVSLYLYNITSLSEAGFNIFTDDTTPSFEKTLKRYLRM